MITAQVKDLCYGLYGETAIPIDPEVQKKALKGYERGDKPITCRPAEVLEPELDKATEEIKDLAVDIDDTLIYALYPVTGKRFLKWKYGKEQPPADVKARTLDEVRAEERFIKKAKAGLVIEQPEREPPEKTENMRTFNVFVDDQYFEVGVEEAGGSPGISYVQPMPLFRPAAAPTAPSPSPEAPKAAAPRPPAPEPAPQAPAPAQPGADTDGTAVEAPMPGMIISYEKDVGDSVNQGETVVILEAMKMENSLPDPASGTIKAVNYISGDTVAKGDILAIIG